ncbi:MAG: methyltransferase domain-containing protein [Alphaproteobacteria bacterium]
MSKLFDLNRADKRRRRAMTIAKPGIDFLLSEAVSELLERLTLVQRPFATAVDLMTPLPNLAEALQQTNRFKVVLRLDRLPATSGNTLFAAADAEAIPLGRESVDLVVSALGLHGANDLPGALAQIRYALKPDGLFLAVLLGGETLTELRQSLTAAEAEITGGATPRVAPFAGVRELGALLHRADLALPVADQDRLIVRYDNALALLHDLRAMGATNTLAETESRPLSRQIIRRMSEIYAERFSEDDGRVTATFDFIWLSGWAPHESQQQPLRPGSARARLAEALSTDEHSTGEKADPDAG